MINILLVEDMTILRDTLAKALNDSENFNVACAIDDSNLANVMCQKHNIDVVLMDIVTLNNSNGIEATFEIKQNFPNIKVILMTGILDINFVEDAKTAGADRFIYKNISSDELIHTITQVINGYTIYPNNSNSKIHDFSISELTKKEQLILRMICEAKTRDEIAKSVGISEGYLRSLISSILSKTGFESITRLSIFAVSHGYIHPKN